MTATLAGSQAALKVLYPNGELPKSINQKFQFLNRMKKEKNFVGELAMVPIQNANPQGSAGTVPAAQAAVQQGNYLRFQLTRIRHYGIARITGEAAEAAVRTEGALVDLWDNETKGIATTEMSTLATYAYGTGDGTLSQILSGSATPTITLPTTVNMNYFELGMSLQAVSTTGLSPVIRALAVANTPPKITAIDRRARTITTTGNWSAAITGLVDTDYLVRWGDAVPGAAAAPTAVITGLGGYVVGGTTPGTLFQLNRNQDPVRLAGQAIDYTGWAMEDAVVDASAQAGFHGVGYPDLLVANNVDVANMKKSLGAKITYQKSDTTGAGATHSFSKLVIEGEAGPIEVLADPFCPRNKAFLLTLDAFSIFSIGAAPSLAKFDGLDVLRIPTDDVYEVRFKTYGQMKCKLPGPQIQLQNFGL